MQRPDLELFLASDWQTNTKVQWTVPPGVVDPRVVEQCQEKIPPKNSLVVNALTGLVWTALPERHVDFLTNANANTPGLALPKPVAAGAA